MKDTRQTVPRTWTIGTMNQMLFHPNALTLIWPAMAKQPPALDRWADDGGAQ